MSDFDERLEAAMEAYLPFNTEPANRVIQMLIEGLRRSETELAKIYAAQSGSRVVRCHYCELDYLEPMATALGVDVSSDDGDVRWACPECYQKLKADTVDTDEVMEGALEILEDIT